MSPESCDQWVKRAHIQWDSFTGSRPLLSLQGDLNGHREDLEFMLDTGAGRTIAPMGYLARFYTETELSRVSYQIDPKDPIRDGDKEGWRTGVCLRDKKIERLQLRDAQGGHFYGFELTVTLHITLKDIVLPIKEPITFSNEAQSALLGRTALRHLGVTFLCLGGIRYFGLFAAPGAAPKKGQGPVYVLAEPEG